jgi:hypothetical protein
MRCPKCRSKRYKREWDLYGWFYYCWDCDYFTNS